MGTTRWTKHNVIDLLMDSWTRPFIIVDDNNPPPGPEPELGENPTAIEWRRGPCLMLRKLNLFWKGEKKLQMLVDWIECASRKERKGPRLSADRVSSWFLTYYIQSWGEFSSLPQDWGLTCSWSWDWIIRHRGVIIWHCKHRELVILPTSGNIMTELD